ncbi:MAG: transposase [Spirochaetes bacterium]|jgi:putative transposase|nr:transposase [Spirochaetota bacterium]
MKTSKFTEPQIIYAPRQAEPGTKVAKVYRKMGISEAIFHKWRTKYGGLGTSELRRFKQLLAENRQLKKLVAGLSLNKQMLQEVIKKRWKTGSAARPCGVPYRCIPYLCPARMPRGHAGPVNLQLHAAPPQ